MKIRDALLQDIPEMQNIGKSIFDDMGYLNQGYKKYYPLNFTFLIETMIVNNNGLVLLAEDDNGNIIGMFAALKAPSLCDIGNRWMEIIWHSDPALHKITQGRIMVMLLREVENRLSNQWLTISLNINKDISSYLSKKGYKANEITYGRRI